MLSYIHRWPCNIYTQHMADRIAFWFVNNYDVDVSQNIFVKMDVETSSSTINHTTSPKKNINCKVGVLSRPDGSAFLCQGTLLNFRF